MSQHDRLNRRAFLKTAGMTALVGAVGTRTSLGTPAASAAAQSSAATYDFEAVYDRVGTDSVKWDAQIARFGSVSSIVLVSHSHHVTYSE